jgi:hypothetical protein
VASLKIPPWESSVRQFSPASQRISAKALLNAPMMKSGWTAMISVSLGRPLGVSFLI